MAKKILLSLSLVAVLSGCIPDKGDDVYGREAIGGNITRFHDVELGVTCYVYSSKALHCLPDHQLMPLEEEQGYYDEEQDVIQTPIGGRETADQSGRLDKAVTRT